MKIEDAISILRQHNGEEESESETFLGNLRPYRGINQAHFSEIVKALYVVAPQLNGMSANRDLVYTVWNLTRTARNCTAGLRDSNFHGHDFINATDKATLDRWIDVIETITLYLLRGFEDWESLCGLPDEINCFESLVHTDWLVPPFIKLLAYHLEMEEQGGSGDDEEILCLALAKIGRPAQSATNILELVATTSKFAHVKLAAESTLVTLEHCQHVR